MDYREQAFRTKFEHAARQLGTVPEQVVSLKLRDSVGSYREYDELMDALTHEAGLRSTPAEGDLQGTGHIVEKSKTKVIVVQHETGLEILYVAASIASLLGLVPLVLKCWRAIRGRMGRPGGDYFGPVEFRRLRQEGHLIEEQSHGSGVPRALPLSAVDSVVLSAAERIDAQLDELRNALHALTGRVAALEDRSSKPHGARKARTAKKRPR